MRAVFPNVIRRARQLSDALTMRVLVLTTFSAPDLGPASGLYTMLCESLVRFGYEVSVLTAMPHYPSDRVAQESRSLLIQHENTKWRSGCPGMGAQPNPFSSWTTVANVRGLSAARQRGWREPAIRRASRCQSRLEGLFAIRSACACGISR